MELFYWVIITGKLIIALFNFVGAWQFYIIIVYVVIWECVVGCNWFSLTGVATGRDGEEGG